MSSSKHILFLTPGFPADENDFFCIPPLQEFLVKFRSIFPSSKISVISFQYPYHNKWEGRIPNEFPGKQGSASQAMICSDPPQAPVSY